MTIHILVEGSSERAFFEGWAPRLLSTQKFRVHPHQGKGSLPKRLDETPDAKARGLLDQLPAKLRGFAASLDAKVDRVLILLDADDEYPKKLISGIVKVATRYAGQLKVSVSVASEETEAFYLGDLRALELVYPAADMLKARNYIPDSICGTWELFGEIVGDGGGNKVAWAEALSLHITTLPAKSRSPSFRDMTKKLKKMDNFSIAPKKKRVYRHAAKPKGSK